MGGQVGPWRLGPPLGKGGTGDVFQATHEETGDEGALKWLSARSASAQRAFLMEVRALRRVRHPQIPAILDQGVSDGRPWLVIERVRGPSLRDALAPYARVDSATLDLDRDEDVPEVQTGAAGPPRALLDVVRSLCAPLGALHAIGLVHGDLKPENTLVVDGRAVLVDFGLARAFLGRDEPEVRQLRGGTPAYLAPEMLLGLPIDGRADGYAFGCLLFEVLAGRPPFVGPGTAVLRAHVDEPPPDLLDLAPDAPPRIAALVRRLLEKDPLRRPAHADEIARALEPEAPPTERPVRGTLVRAPFVGRSPALQRLRAGTGVTAVTGGSGLGRSRLLAELGLGLEADGVTHVVVGAREGLAERLRSLLSPERAAEVPLLRSLFQGDLRPGGPLFSAAAELLAGDRGGWLLVDDLHLCDEWTAAFVRWAAEAEGGPEGLRVVVTLDPAQATDDSAALLPDRVELAPLDPSEASALAGGWLGVPADDPMAVEVATIAGGVPSELSRMVRAWVDAEVLVRRDERWTWAHGAPERDDPRARSVALATDPVAAALAMVGGEVDPDVVAALVGDRGEVLDRWFEGEREGWLAGGRWVSERLRRAVVAAIPTALAGRLRRGLLAHVADPPAVSLEVLVGAAIAESDPRASGWGLALAQQLRSNGRVDAATGWLEALEPLGTPEEQVAVSSALASLTQVARTERSHAAALRAAALAEQVGSPHYAVCCSQVANAARILGRFDEARAWHERAVAHAPDPETQARAACDLSAVELDLGRWDEALAWCARVRALGDAVPARTRAITAANEAGVALRQGREEAGIALVEEALAFDDERGLELQLQAVCHLNLSTVASRGEPWALDHWQQGMRVARRLGGWRLLCHGMATAVGRGWTREAVAWLADLDGVARRSGLRQARAAAVVARAQVERRAGGDVDRVALEGAAEVLERTGERRQHAVAVFELGLGAIRAGEPAGPWLDRLRAIGLPTVDQEARLAELQAAADRHRP